MVILLRNSCRGRNTISRAAMVDRHASRSPFFRLVNDVTEFLSSIFPLPSFSPLLLVRTRCCSSVIETCFILIKKSREYSLVSMCMLEFLRVGEFLDEDIRWREKVYNCIYIALFSNYWLVSSHCIYCMRLGSSTGMYIIRQIFRFISLVIDLYLC